MGYEDGFFYFENVSKRHGRYGPVFVHEFNETMQLASLRNFSVGLSIYSNQDWQKGEIKISLVDNMYKTIASVHAYDIDDSIFRMIGTYGTHYYPLNDEPSISHARSYNVYISDFYAYLIFSFWVDDYLNLTSSMFGYAYLDGDIDEEDHLCTLSNLEGQRIIKYLVIEYVEYESTSSPAWPMDYGIDGLYLECGPDMLHPAIEGPVITPSFPTPDDDVIVTVNITDAGGVDTVNLHYDIGDGWNVVPMSITNGEYSTTIPASPLGTVVKYQIFTNDTLGNAVFTAESTYTVILFDLNMVYSFALPVILVLCCICTIIVVKRRKKPSSESPVTTPKSYFEEPQETVRVSVPDHVIPEEKRTNQIDVRTVRLPTKCPSCGAPLLHEELDWTGPLQTKCNYCGSPVRAYLDEL